MMPHLRILSLVFFILILNLSAKGYGVSTLPAPPSRIFNITQSTLLKTRHFCQVQMGKLQQMMKRDPSSLEITRKHFNFMTTDLANPILAPAFKSIFGDDLKTFSQFLYENDTPTNPYTFEHASLARLELKNKLNIIYLLTMQRTHSKEIYAFVDHGPNRKPYRWQQLEVGWDLLKQAKSMGLQPVYELNSKGEVLQREFQFSPRHQKNLSGLVDLSSPQVLVSPFVLNGTTLSVFREKQGRYDISIKERMNSAFEDNKDALKKSDIDAIFDAAIFDTGIETPLLIKFRNGHMICNQCASKFMPNKSSFDFALDTIDNEWLAKFEENLKFRFLEAKKNFRNSVLSRESNRLLGLTKEQTSGTENSGFETIAEAREYLGWEISPSIDPHIPYVAPDIDSNLTLLRVSDRYYEDYSQRIVPAELVLRYARSRPLMITKTDVGGYLVYIKYIQSRWGPWGTDVFALFKTAQLANYYIRNHRFAVEHRSR